MKRIVDLAPSIKWGTYENSIQLEYESVFIKHNESSFSLKDWTWFCSSFAKEDVMNGIVLLVFIFVFPKHRGTWEWKVNELGRTKAEKMLYFGKLRSENVKIMCVWNSSRKFSFLTSLRQTGNSIHQLQFAPWGSRAVLKVCDVDVPMVK